MPKKPSKKKTSTKKKVTKKKTPAQKREETKKHIMDTYVKFVRKHRRNPTEAELQKKGVTRNSVRYHYGNPTSLKEKARKEYPDAFEGIIDETLFTKKNLAELKRTTTKHKKFVITTAVSGCKVHEKFYKSLQNYCEENDALLLVVPVAAPSTNLPKASSNTTSWELDRFLGQEYAEDKIQVCFGDLGLNNNLFVSGIKLSAKQIDPTTGLSGLSRGCSFIFGSPKQRMRVKANAKHKHPHIMHGTGAVTKPNYETESYMSKRTSYLAEFQHQLGALVVEVDKGETFHLRQLQGENDTGNFVDLSYYYKPNGKVERMYPEAFTLGDWHSGDTDPTAKKAWKEVVEYTRPSKLILHDFLNGKSINPHERKQHISRAMLAQEGKTNLERELKFSAKDLDELTQWTEDGVVVVRSNHDEFLVRYLEDGLFLKDRENLFTATKLVNAMSEGEDPVQFGIEQYCKEDTKEKVKWLEMDESFKIAGIEHGAHGHAGPNGSKGTLKNHEEVYGACTIGHSHTPGILRDAYQVGTSSHLDEGFNVGGSSWMHTSCLTYPNGSRQLVTSINGKWKK